MFKGQEGSWELKGLVVWGLKYGLVINFLWNALLNSSSLLDFYLYFHSPKVLHLSHDDFFLYFLGWRHPSQSHVNDVSLPLLYSTKARLETFRKRSLCWLWVRVTIIPPIRPIFSWGSHCQFLRWVIFFLPLFTLYAIPSLQKKPHILPTFVGFSLPAISQSK